MKSKLIKTGSSWNVSTNSTKPFSNKKIIQKFKKNFKKLKVVKQKKRFKEKAFLMLNPNKIKR